MNMKPFSLGIISLFGLAYALGASADCGSPDIVDRSSGAAYGPGEVYVDAGEVRVDGGDLRFRPGTIVKLCGDSTRLVIADTARIFAQDTVRDVGAGGAILAGCSDDRVVRFFNRGRKGVRLRGSS